MLPITQPDYATIHKEIGIVSDIELSFCDDKYKNIFKLHIFDKKRAQIEEIKLTNFDPIKRQYNDIIGKKLMNINGLKDVRKAISDFTDKARTSTFNKLYSSYHTEVYYK